MNKLAVISVFVVLATIASGAVIKDDDDCICTMEYDPLCAHSGHTGKAQTFANKCEYNCAANSKKGKALGMFIQHYGECSDQFSEQAPEDCICTREMNPVCGSDSNTYSNECEFNCVANSKKGKALGMFLQHYGECSDQFTDCICTFEFNPVCGSDSHTYSNECEFNCAAKSKKGKAMNMFIQHYGQCSDQF